MTFHFMLKGMAIGFSIAAPVGPIGVLCIRRSLAEGRLIGLATGLGAATADILANSDSCPPSVSEEKFQKISRMVRE